MKFLKLLAVFFSLTILFVTNCSDVTFDNVLDKNGTSYIGDKLAMPWPEDDPDGIACMYNPDCPYYVKDEEGPKITLKGDNPATIPYGDPNNILAKLKEQVSVYDEWEKREFLLEEISVTTNVAVFTAGEYEIVYEATDKDGNTTTKKREVIVESENISQDNTKPSIFILGDVVDGTITITEGDDFNISDYYGASDKEDSDLDANDLKISGSYDNKKAGEYKGLKVYVKDSNGEKTEKEFTLIVKKKVTDNNPPTLELKGDLEFDGLGSFDEFEEPGYKTSDPDDDDVDVKIVVDSSQGSIFIIMYTAVDEHGAKSSILKRTVRLKTGKPVITVKLENGQLVSGNELTVLLRSEFKPVVTAKDADGKEIDEDNIQTRNNVVTTKVGVYSLIITAIDDNENETVREITVKVRAEDKKAPVITIEGFEELGSKDKKEIVRYSDNTEKFETPKATAIDDDSTDLTDSIKIEGDDKVNIAKEGTYKISYTVSDSAGNEASDTVFVKIKLPSSMFLDKYGVPGEKFPSSYNGQFTSFKLEGENPPNLTNLKGFSISWGQSQFYSIQLTFKNEPYNVPLKVGTNLTHNFDTNEPAELGFTTGIDGGLDNEYYVAIDDSSLILVQKDGDFAIIWEK